MNRLIADCIDHSVMLILQQFHLWKSQVKALDVREEDSLQVKPISFLSEIIDYNTLFTLKNVNSKVQI